MFFHAPQKRVTVPKLMINNIDIECVTSFNYLGIILDKHLSWDQHIKRIVTKLSKTIGILNRLKHFLPSHILKTIYHSLITPHLNYGILAWGYQANKLVTLQKKAIRIITNSKYNAHTEAIFKELNLLKLTDLFKLNKLKFLYKLQNKSLPEYFCEHFKITLNRDVHEYNTRRKNNAHVIRKNREIAKKSLRNDLANLFNITPHNIKDKINTHCLTGFTIYIRNILLDQYSNVREIVDCYICGKGVH